MSQLPFSDGPRPVGISEHHDTLAAGRDAVDRVIAAAQHELRIFECDLSDPGYRAAERAVLLEKFLAARRSNRLLISLHETAHLEREAPRLLALLRRYSHAIEIRATFGPARGARDCLVIADRHSYWHRMHIDQPRSVSALGDATAAAPLLDRFEEIWASSDPAVSATVLGL